MGGSLVVDWLSFIEGALCVTQPAIHTPTHTQAGVPVQDRNAWLAVLKHDYHHQRQLLADQFNLHHKPFAYLKAHSQLLDSVIIRAMNDLMNESPATLCCMAVGGYGRQELFPYSDIDIMFITQIHNDAKASAQIQSVLYVLWDLGLKVGHATHSVKQAIELAHADHTVTATLLDRRYICGSRALCDKLDTQFESKVRGKQIIDFVEAKLQERAARHAKQGNSRFFLQPNIKENKGGLRDIHSLYWLVNYVYGVPSLSGLTKLGLLDEKEVRDFRNAQEFLSAVRICLHLLSHRAEEQLTFDWQRQIGETLGYQTTHEHRPVERFMKRYFQVAKIVGDLTRLLCAILEDEHKRKPRFNLPSILERTRQLDDFIIQGQRVHFRNPDDVAHKPSLLLALFHTAQIHDLDIHPHALRVVSRSLKLIDPAMRSDAKNNHIFMKILLSPKDPEGTLRRMNEAGVLGKWIPPFGHLVGQMQYDLYHVYTVDEHILRALGMVHAIEKGELAEALPLATRIIKHVESRECLYLAILCHDIAKGTGGNHPEKGAIIAIELAKRFGLDDTQAHTTAWLVREHVLCSDVAFKRDLNDPKTIEDFVARVQSPERLRLLLILTVCDIRAVGPHIWNGWKGALLRDLYARAEQLMGTPSYDHPADTAHLFQAAIQPALQGWSEEEKARYFELGHAGFWMSCGNEQHAAIAAMLRESWRAPEAILMRHHIDTFRSITSISLCMPDYPGLINLIAGTLAIMGATICAAKLFVLRDGTAIALFEIQNHQYQAFDDTSRLNTLTRNLHDCFAHKIDLRDEVKKHQNAYPAPLAPPEHSTQMFIDNHLSERYTVIEINAIDRIGLLYDITHALGEAGLTIATAHIMTYGQNVVDVFYVKDIFGLKIEHATKLALIREQVMTRLETRLA